MRFAMGARKAFQEHADLTERQLWLKHPFTGIDGLPTEGQAWVDQGTSNRDCGGRNNDAIGCANDREGIRWRSAACGAHRH